MMLAYPSQKLSPVLGCYMVICAAVAGKQLKCACRQFLLSVGSRERHPQYRAKSPFCAVRSSARAEVHSARLPVAHSVGFAAPRIFLIPTFLCSPAQHFHSFPLCFLPGAEAAECIRPSPNRSCVNASLLAFAVIS